MSKKLVERLRKRVIKNFLDILVLTEMKDKPLSGYDVIGLIHKKYDILLSSGTIYSLLYSLERDCLIKGVQNQRERVYTLTEKGEGDWGVITKSNNKLQHFLRDMMLLSQS